MMTSTSSGRTRLLRLFSLALIAPLGAVSGAAIAAPSSCSGNSGNKADITQASNTSAVEGTPITLNVHNSSKGVTFAWSYVSGPFVAPSPATGDSTSFVLPQVGVGGAVLTMRLTASGCTGNPSVDTEDFVVNITDSTPAPNFEPVAVASASPSSVNEGATVSLIGTGSYDPENDALTYSWEQTSGPAVSISNANTALASFVAPSVSSTTTLGFKLTVAEATGGLKTANASVSVNVLNVNVPPVASLTCPAYVDEGQTITLDGSASNDPDSGVLFYDFTQFSALPMAAIPAPPHGSTVSFPAPSLGPMQTGLVQFTLTVTDGDNASNSAQCSVFINDVTGPVLSGGGDQTLEAVSPAGAPALFTVDANDAVEGPKVVTCIPPSGSDFPLGATAVACGASDSHGNIGTLGFTITVEDTIGPVIAPHADEGPIEATGPNGAQVDYTAPATSDAYDGAGVADCTPPPGSTFALGHSTVTCNAIDTNGNSAAATSFDVEVVDTTAPAIGQNADITAEATGANGAPVSFANPTATDVVDGDVPVTCEPASGSTFALGTSLVTCSASDNAGNTGVSYFNVTVEDTTAPEISAHANEVVEATGASGATVNYVLPTASDIVEGGVEVNCTPSSGSTFALGTTTVECSATDAAGNEATSSFTVTVRDTTPPSITAHGNEVAEATGPSGAAVNYTSPTASDIVDGSVAVVCTPASGSTFALGTTTVNCSATDAAGNEATSSFSVTVQDTTAPSISAHADVNAIATSASGAVVTYTLPTASDLVDGSVAVTCLPASGSTFAIGSTTVNCSATDSHGNTGTSSFNVVVSYAFNGFFKPIDNLPIVNVVKAGQGIPVKFSLGGNMGLNIFAAGYPRSVQMVCNGAVSDTVEETVTAGGSSLSYDATAGQYIYVWKSEKAWAGTCRQLQVKLADGTYHYANFNFTR